MMNMLENKIQRKVEASATSDDTIQLYLHGPVGSWYDGFDFKAVQKALEGFNGSEIELHLNSFGGDMFEGIAIKNFLKQRTEKITVIIDGIAASAASIIAMAGDKILMPKDTQLMIHNPWTVACGNADELRKVADDLDKAELSIQESYLERFVGNLEELVALLDEESYLTADEAIAFGLADGIFDYSETESNEESAVESISKNSLLAKYGGQSLAAQSNTKQIVEEARTSVEGIENFVKLFTR